MQPSLPPVSSPIKETTTRHQLLTRGQEPAVARRVKRGDLWQLGRHRLLCGDSTDVAQVTRLMDGERAALTKNGVMDPGVLYDRQPFTNLSSQGIEGLFPEAEVDNILAIVRRINANAGIMAGQAIGS